GGPMGRAGRAERLGGWMSPCAHLSGCAAVVSFGTQSAVAVFCLYGWPMPVRTQDKVWCSSSELRSGPRTLRALHAAGGLPIGSAFHASRLTEGPCEPARNEK